MQRDDLDRFLRDDDIVPSSGFVARVMDAVHAVPPVATVTLATPTIASRVTNAAS